MLESCCSEPPAAPRPRTLDSAVSPPGEDVSEKLTMFLLVVILAFSLAAVGEEVPASFSGRTDTEVSVAPGEVEGELVFDAVVRDLDSGAVILKKQWEVCPGETRAETVEVKGRTSPSDASTFNILLRFETNPKEGAKYTLSVSLGGHLQYRHVTALGFPDGNQLNQRIGWHDGLDQGLLEREGEE